MHLDWLHPTRSRSRLKHPEAPSPPSLRNNRCGRPGKVGSKLAKTTYSTHICAIREDVRSTLILQDPNVEVNLWYLDRVGGRAVEIKTLIVKIPITLITVHHMLLATD